MPTVSTPTQQGVRIAAGLALVAGTLLTGFLLLVYVFNPVANERACKQGEAPANAVAGGSACFPEGSVLPDGYTWDLRGNFEL